MDSRDQATDLMELVSDLGEAAREAEAASDRPGPDHRETGQPEAGQPRPEQRPDQPEPDRPEIVVANTELLARLAREFSGRLPMELVVGAVAGAEARMASARIDVFVPVLIERYAREALREHERRLPVW